MRGRFEARCIFVVSRLLVAQVIYLIQKWSSNWKSTNFSPMIPSTLGKLMFTKMSESYWLLENMQMAAVIVADWMCTSPTWLRTARFQATARKSRTWHWKNLESTDFISATCYFHLLRFWKEMGPNSLTYNPAFRLVFGRVKKALGLSSGRNLVLPSQEQLATKIFGEFLACTSHRDGLGMLFSFLMCANYCNPVDTS